MAEISGPASPLPHLAKVADAVVSVVMLVEAVAALMPGGTHRIGQQLAIVHAAVDAMYPPPPPVE